LSIILALPKLGRLGQVGSVDVDAETAEVLLNPSLIKQTSQNANDLAKRAGL